MIWNFIGVTWYIVSDTASPLEYHTVTKSMEFRDEFYTFDVGFVLPSI